MDQKAIANFVAAMQARMPDGWQISGPTQERGGWTFGVHPTSNPIVGTDIWRETLEGAMDELGVQVESLRAANRPN
jgi:hypothetical protein